VIQTSPFFLLFLLLLGLKLGGVIAWSWWLVTAPLWIPLLVLVLFLVGIVALSVWNDRR
jgi:hypothetical protein